METGVIRLSTKGRLEMGDVPSPARVIKAMPTAHTSTPVVKMAKRRRASFRLTGLTPYLASSQELSPETVKISLCTVFSRPQPGSEASSSRT